MLFTVTKSGLHRTVVKYNRRHVSDVCLDSYIIIKLRSEEDAEMYSKRRQHVQSWYSGKWREYIAKLFHFPIMNTVLEIFFKIRVRPS